MNTTEPDIDQPGIEQTVDELATQTLGRYALNKSGHPALASLGRQVLKSFRSPVAEAIGAEADRRAAWLDEVSRPFAEAGAALRKPVAATIVSQAAARHGAWADQLKVGSAFADVASAVSRSPVADALAAFDKQIAPMRDTMARLAKVTRAQQDTTKVLRSLPALDPPAIAKPSDTLTKAMGELHAATAAREDEQRARQAATVELLQQMVDHQDEILRGQEAQLEIARKADQRQRGTRVTANLAAIGALGAVLVVIAPTLWMQLLVLPTAALLYAAVLAGHALLAKRRST